MYKSTLYTQPGILYEMEYFGDEKVLKYITFYNVCFTLHNLTFQIYSLIFYSTCSNKLCEKCK